MFRHKLYGDLKNSNMLVVIFCKNEPLFFIFKTLICNATSFYILHLFEFL